MNIDYTIKCNGSINIEVWNDQWNEASIVCNE